MWTFSDQDLTSMFDSEGFGEDFRPLPPPLATHCDVPLKYNKQRAAINKPSIGQHSQSQNQYWREWQAIQAVYGPSFVDYYDVCHFQHYFLNVLHVNPHMKVLAEFEQQQRVSKEVWKIQSKSVYKIFSEKLNLPNFNLDPFQIDLLKKYYFRRAFFEEAVLSSGSDSYTPEFWWKKDIKGVVYYQDFHVKFACTKNLFYGVISGRSFLASRDHLLVISDLASQRYLLLEYALFDNSTHLPRFFPHGLLQEYFEAGDLLIQAGGNDSYKLIYTMEPLCLSYLIGDMPVGTPSGQSFQNLILNELSIESTKLKVENELLRLINIIKIANQLGPSYISELYGLYRIWGHPTLEPLEGTIALKKIATAVRFTNQNMVSKITNKFKEEFICRYISKEHVWPDLDTSRLPQSNILNIAYQRKAPYPNKHKNYRRSDLELIRFNQIFPIDPKFDLIELIADKALSLITPELISTILTNQNCGSASARSVLLNWLKSPIHDPEEFLRNIDKYGFPKMEKTVGVREKEREGKLKARLFGLMTLFKRMYIVLTEALIAEHLIPFFPEITMIDDELSLDKKRFSFTQSSGEDQIIVSLDFSKWNSNMRKNETFPLFQIFDNMFGFENCFTRTHEMFENSALYLLNGTYLPNITPEGQLKPDLGCWYGHLGGIEGLRQKGWTLWTVSLILLASENLPFRLSLMGQGDNQLLRLRFPQAMNEEENNKILYQFLGKLDEILSTTGPPLKLEETWASRDLFVYGKYLIFKGSPLPTSGKRIARMFRLANEDFPTIESALSSATANLTSSLACNLCIGPLFLIYLTEVIGILQLGLRSQYLQSTKLQEHFSYPQSVKIPGEKLQIKDVPVVIKPVSNQEDLLYTSILFLPRGLGGFPILTLFDCLVRGFPDEISFGLASLKLFYPHCNSKLQNILQRICSPPINKLKNFELLSEHPTVLNLEIPPAPGESRRNLIIDFLKSEEIPINPYVRTFLNILNSQEDKELLTYLTHIEPFNPRIISLFMSATAEYRARHVAGKLQKTKTIANVARVIGSVDLYSKIIEAERNHFGSVIRVLFSSRLNTIHWNPTLCSVSHADNLRELSWGKRLVGVSCVPPQEFMILEPILINYKCDLSNELDKGYVAIRLSPNYALPDFKNPFLFGGYPPYRGSITRQKVSGYGDKIAAQAEPILQRVLRLFSLVGWGIPKDGNLHKLCIKLLNSRTDLDPDLLHPSDEEITGSIHHRLQDLRTGHGGSVPVLPNFGTKIMFDTFPLIAYSKGSKNVNLMFQSFMSCAVVLIGEAISLDWQFAQPVIHLHVKSSCCVQEVQDDMSENPISCDIIHFATFKENPYLFVDLSKIQILLSKGIRFQVNTHLNQDPISFTHRYHSILAEECFHILSPHSWDRPTTTFRVHQLVINWMLVCNTSLLFHYLSLRIVSHYLGAIRESNVENYLFRVAERVERSPLEYWKSLSSLIFAPNLQHHLVGSGIRSSLSGNPICTESNLAVSVRLGVSTIILAWRNKSIRLNSLTKLDPYGRPFCGLSQHPSILLATSQLLQENVTMHEIHDLRQSIMNKLTSKSEIDLSPSLKMLSQELIKQGQIRISGENLDFMCKSKSIMQFPLSQERKPSVVQIDSDYKALIELNFKQMMTSQYRLEAEDDLLPHPDYTLHLIKLAQIPTTGAYKCLSILPNLPVKTPKFIGCFGDGSGGFTLATCLFYPTAQVFYNSLVGSEIPIQQCSPIPFIPALAGHPDLEERIVGLNLTTEFISDLTHPHLGHLIKQQISKNFDLIMCDAEFSSKDSLMTPINLINGIIRIARITSCNIVVFKTYLKNVSVVYAQINLILSAFENIQICRSNYSSIHNTEVYLVISGLRYQDPTYIKPNYLFEGKTILPKHLQSIYLIRDNFIKKTNADFPKTHTAYTMFLNDSKMRLSIIDVNKVLPYCVLNKLLIYPNDWAKWIFETSSKTPGEPKTYHIRLETFTLHHHLLKRWAFAGLINLILSNVNYHIHTIRSNIEKGYLIWFRTCDKKWDISFWFNQIPDFSKTRGVKSFKLSDLISLGDLKAILRYVGLLLQLKIHSLNINKQNKEIRGFTSFSGSTYHREHQAENVWIQEFLQGISPRRTTSDI